ncbi:MAG: HAMP domain-containing protein [Undibacterium sp.]|nr:HAMP domain-containing protein [Undibacterium sp.]
MFRSKVFYFITSITAQFTWVALLATFLLMGSAWYAGNRTLKTAMLENVNTSIFQTSQLLNLTVSTYASNNDLATVQIFFDEMIDKDAKNGLAYVVVVDSLGRVVLSTQTKDFVLPKIDLAVDLERAAKRGAIHVRNAILLPGNEAGFLQYGLSTRNIVSAMAEERTSSLLRTAFVMLLGFSAIVFLGRRITHRMNQVIQASQAIVAGNYQLHISVTGHDELSQMAEYFNRMADAVQTKINEITALNLSLEDRVLARTSELATSKQLLEENLIRLKEAQKQLINAEKMASLGSLVAGVAHELNTPIGNAFMVSTTLSHKVETVRELSTSSKMRKTDFERFLADMDEAAELIYSNLRRAAELISSFKTVAVDQTSEQKRLFNLAQTMDGLVCTLKPQLKQTKISMTMHIPSTINLNSYPGPLIQVLTNLFNNALIHGFEQKDEGEIHLTARIDPFDDRYVRFYFSDNGRGIAPDDIDKIFDPFFTTKLGQGGSGLGLSICYNIVVGILKGKISVISEHGDSGSSGTEFMLRIPLDVA